MTTRTEPDLISNFTYDWCPMSVGKPCEAYAANGFYRALSYDTQGRVSQIYSEIDSPTAPYLIHYAFISSAVVSAGAGLTLEGLSTVVTIGNALGSVTAGFAGGLINGGGDFKAGLQGALTAGLFFGVGELGLGAGSAANVAAHPAVGCASSAASGGRCGSGAMGAGFGEFAGPILPDLERIGNTVTSAVLGGTGSVLGGGKFANGAITGAYGYLFNELGSCYQRGYCTRDRVTDQRISKLNSSLRLDAITFINETYVELGVDLRVSQGLRTLGEQNALYAQGRTRQQLDAVGLTGVQPRPGPVVTNAYGTQSYHTSGNAFDVVRLNGSGGVNWTPIDRGIGDIGSRFGFSWGGDWRRPDYPDLQR